MKLLLTILAALTMSMAALAKPQCQGFNNYDNKVTITFSDRDTADVYEVSDVKLRTNGREYGATEVKAERADGEMLVTLTFPHLTQFSNPTVTLRINGKKTKFKVCH